MSKTIKLKPKKAKNYDKFFESVVTDCACIIVDAMKSSKKGDDLVYEAKFVDKTMNETHKIQIVISKEK